MPLHTLDAYIDNFKHIVFCRVCSAEEPFESSECPGKYVPSGKPRPVENDPAQNNIFQCGEVKKD